MNQHLSQPESHDFSPEEQAFMDKEYANQPRIEDAQRCRLPASGFTETLDDVYDWACSLVNQLNQLRVAGKPIQAFVWTYREQSCEWVALGLDGGIDAWIEFLIGEPHNFHAGFDDGGVIAVPDMTEALHMIGKRVNEVNPYCTPSQWVPGQTFAPLKVVSQVTDGSLAK